MTLKRHYSKLPPVAGFARIPDDEHGRRMLRCDSCGQAIPSLGVGYHKQGRPCDEEDDDWPGHNAAVHGRVAAPCDR